MTAAFDWGRALDDFLKSPERLHLVFQPIVDLRRETVTGYEALARFDGPEANPARWFAAAHAAGLGHRLDAIVLDEAMSARTRLPRNCFLTVNVSPSSLTHPEVLDRLTGAGSLAGLTIEVTEHESVDDYAALLSAVGLVRSLGGCIAVDDAGAGYSSLQHIIKVRPEFVKIDRVFVDGIDEDPAKSCLVEAIGGLVGRLDAWVIAEGIERPEELAELRRLGVPLGQGYLLARPAVTFAARLEARVTPVVESAEARPTLAPLFDPVPTRRVDLDERAASGAEFTVGVDVWQRPRVLFLADGSTRPILKVSLDATPEGVLARALARDPARRFDPVVCTDEDGRLLGLVRFERLVAALLPRNGSLRYAA